MQNVRESSQQERRVYVGNLAYDVKWHHLKDFMRQGKSEPISLLLSFIHSFPCYFLFCIHSPVTVFLSIYSPL